MYTIKEAARRAGLSTDVTRAWERRYGVVTPTRTATGYRVYDEAAIARLRAMRRLIDDGWTASVAALAVRDRSTEELLAADQPAVRRPPRRATPGADISGKFVHAAADLDAAGVERALDEAFAAGTYEAIVDRLLMPALRDLGEAWQDGRIDVAGEHMASHAMLRRLGASYQAAARPAAAGTVVVGLPPGARHELGALAFCVGARRAGIPVVYLGGDLPVADWLHAATRDGVRAAVIGIVTAADREPAMRVARALVDTAPSLQIFFGGVGAEGLATAFAGRAVELPAGIVAAVDALARGLSSP